ncbi:MAG: cytochrome c biogenesis protein CcsA [Dechloromonas sp.]|nr:cytochrome c biogenesis protein CcsA [Dechloromonas sp.]
MVKSEYIRGFNVDLFSSVIALLIIFVWPVLGWYFLILAFCVTLFGVSTFRSYFDFYKISNGLILGSFFAIIILLLTDNFSIRFVWFYSSVDIPWYQKLANAFCAEEGAILWLVVYFSFAVRLVANKPDIQRYSLIFLKLWYLIAVIYLNPFLQTDLDKVSQGSGLGMNAHLSSIWMLVHPPLVLGAYALILLIIPASLQELSSGRALPQFGLSKMAIFAWCILSGGLGFGIVWAFQDVGYGQYWHWDPVQTSIFSTWLLLTAYVHLLPIRKNKTIATLKSVIGIFSGLCVLMTLVLTRSEYLASSHKYVGNSTIYWHAFLAVVVVFAMVALIVLKQNRRKKKCVGVTSEIPAIGFRLKVIYLVVALFIICLAITIFGISEALFRQYLDIEKPRSLMPFYETLRAWSGTDSKINLDLAFKTWDLDGVKIVSYLALPLSAMFYIGGFYFVRRVNRVFAIVFLGITIVGYICWYFNNGYLESEYSGSGLLSSRVASLLPLIDNVIYSASVFFVGSLLYALDVLLRARSLASANTVIPTTCIHIGIVLVILAGAIGTTLNSYTQRSETKADLTNGWKNFGEGYSLRILESKVEANQRTHNYKEFATIELETPDSKSVLSGNIYVDLRSVPRDYSGPVRSICELIDYRYARYVGRTNYTINPLIMRSIKSDTQVWISTIGSSATTGNLETVIVIKKFPFASLMWIGLALCFCGSAWISVNRVFLIKKNKSNRDA